MHNENDMQELLKKLEELKQQNQRLKEKNQKLSEKVDRKSSVACMSSLSPKQQYIYTCPS